jgi:hypothetical protein
MLLCRTVRTPLLPLQQQQQQHGRQWHGRPRAAAADTTAMLLDMLRRKDEELYKKDDDLRMLLKQNDERERRKDDDLRRKDEDLRMLNHVNAERVRLQCDLRVAQDTVMKLNGYRNLRGALEYIASTMGTEARGGVQKRLNKLLDEPEFETTLQEQATRFNVSYDQAESCMQSIYRTLSQEMHGSDEEVQLLYSVITAPVQRAVLHALLEYKCIRYTVID